LISGHPRSGLRSVTAVAYLRDRVWCITKDDECHRNSLSEKRWLRRSMWPEIIRLAYVHFTQGIPGVIRRLAWCFDTKRNILTE
jgi:hypothetical protein